MGSRGAHPDSAGLFGHITAETNRWPPQWLVLTVTAASGGIDRLFDFPAEDLATAGRVLAILTARANAELTAR